MMDTYLKFFIIFFEVSKNVVKNLTTLLASERLNERTTLLASERLNESVEMNGFCDCLQSLLEN